MDWLLIIELVITFAVLALASWQDWKLREASDGFWIFLGTLGIILLAYQIWSDGVDPLYFLFLLPLSVLFYDIFWDRKGLWEDGLNLPAILAYAAAIISVVILLIEFQTASYLWQLLVIPIVILLFILFYQLDVIKGGADAKALISLAILFPTYPAIGPFPLIPIPPDPVQFAFPFALLVLFNAALVMLALPIAFLIINLKRRDVRFPLMFFGYKMEISQARNKFVWPMEKLENGRKRFILMPKDDDSDEEIINELESSGEKEMWVTPKIPFLIPITASLVISTLIGNLLFLFILK